MPSPPAGQVTLVFTDLQGSTELWERLGTAFQPILERHHAILRERLAARSGYEVKTEGDAFMVAFGLASDALAFALETQEALHAEMWPTETGPLLVRMGIHTGEPLCITDSATGRADYYGPAVNRAARIAGAAHGGQVLLSRVAWELAAASRSTAVGVSLGEHRLKGLERPEQLWQALPPSLSTRTFPPPKTVSARATNLPSPATSFVGREREIRELTALLCDPATRLLTLTGPGGTGKTRLSLRVAAELLDRFEGGVWFADLSEAKSAADIAEAVARPLGIPLADRSAPEERVATALAFRKPLLLILDNFEQVVACARETIGRWRDAAPEIRFLVTSRSLLGLAGEQEFEVPPLGVPSGHSASGQTSRLESFDGVRLFLERARESDPKFRPDSEQIPAVAELCLRLEGIPLAIELAAARLKVLKPTEMLARLDQRFQVLRSTRRDLPPRQQTLLGAVAWSYDLLAPWEKSAFHQACVFRGGFRLEDAEAVLSLPPDAPDGITAIQTLREKSFLRTTETPLGTRFGMYVTLREFGMARWAEQASAADQHALGHRHATRTVTSFPQPWERADGIVSQEDLDRLQAEEENLRAAGEWAAAAGETELACRAAVCLAPLLQLRGPVHGLRELLERAIATPGVREGKFQLQARHVLAVESGRIGDPGRAAELFREVEERAGPVGLPLLRLWAALGRHQFLRVPTGAPEAIAELREIAAAFRASGKPSGEVAAQVYLAARILQTDIPAALEVLNQAETLALRSPDPSAVLPVILERARVLELRGQFQAALDDLNRAEAVLRSRREKHRLATCLLARGRVMQLAGLSDRDYSTFAEAAQIWREAGAKADLAEALGAWGSLALMHRDMEPAARLLEESARLAGESGNSELSSKSLNALGLLRARTSDLAGAERILTESARASMAAGLHFRAAQANMFLADAWGAAGEWARALPPAEEAFRLYEAIGATSCLPPARISRGLVRLEVGRAAECAADQTEALRELEALGQGGFEIAIRGRIFLGRALAATGDFDGARRLLDRTREETAETVRNHPQLGGPLMEELKKLEAAVGRSAC